MAPPHSGNPQMNTPSYKGAPPHETELRKLASSTSALAEHQGTFPGTLKDKNDFPIHWEWENMTNY